LNVIIRNERKDELKVVENTIRDAFWNVYKPGCDEHLMAHQLHEI
jgi:predicted N-acetyltransferase YhbS